MLIRGCLFEPLGELTAHFKHERAVQDEQLLLGHSRHIALIAGHIWFREIKESERGIGRISADDRVERAATSRRIVRFKSVEPIEKVEPFNFFDNYFNS